MNVYWVFSLSNISLCFSVHNNFCSFKSLITNFSLAWTSQFSAKQKPDELRNNGSITISSTGVSTLNISSFVSVYFQKWTSVGYILVKKITKNNPLTSVVQSETTYRSCSIYFLTPWFPTSLQSHLLPLSDVVKVQNTL